jgi:hypothetical protein
MVNPKKQGNEYEQHITGITSEILGAEFKPTQRSGGAWHKGDSRNFKNETPLSRYCQEIKKHNSMVAFNRSLKSDIEQAITQTPANKNWQLVTWHPGIEADLVVMDYQDYLHNEILGQMVGNKKNLRFAMSKIEKGLRMVKAGVAQIRREVK